MSTTTYEYTALSAGAVDYVGGLINLNSVYVRTLSFAPASVGDVISDAAKILISENTQSYNYLVNLPNPNTVSVQYRSFRWATDDSKDKSDVSIYNNFTHLGLNWKDTELFQNPNNQKFTDIRKRYAPLIEKDKSPAKGIDMTEGGVLMRADDADKIIRINDYINWINCNYGLRLETNISTDFDNSLPDPYKDMDICFNSAMKYPITNNN